MIAVLIECHADEVVGSCSALDNPANVTLEDGLRAIIRAGTSALHLESIDVGGPAGCAGQPAAAGEAIPADSARDGHPRRLGVRSL